MSDSRLVIREEGDPRPYVVELPERPIGEFHQHMLRAVSGSYRFLQVSSNRNRPPNVQNMIREVMSNQLDFSTSVNTIPVFVAEGNVGECSICMDDITDKDEFRRLPCSDTVNHCFHKDCIDKWLRSNNTCPNCRSKLF